MSTYMACVACGALCAAEPLANGYAITCRRCGRRDTLDLTTQQSSASAADLFGCVD